jgi:hypothetical protein
MGQASRSMLDPVLQERFSNDEFQTLSAWCENSECSVEFVQWLGGGWSGAKLAVVFLEDNNGSRKVVLKYCPSRDGRSARDFLAFRKSADSGPRGFAKAHLVGLDRGADKPIPCRNDGLFLIMDYRTQGYHQYDTMTLLLDREALGVACKIIVPQILVKWNSGKVQPRRTSGGMAARDFLREILGHRYEAGGSVYAAITRLETAMPDLYTTDSGQKLPRPLAAVITGENVEDIRLSGFRGNAHGDLHVDNILVPILVNAPPAASDFEKFILIDLSTFEDNRLLAVDPTHLLLSIIARRLQDLSPQARNRLSDLVLDPEHGETGGVPTELAQAVHAIHGAGIQFAEPRNLYNEWREETWAAVVACALLFVGRGLPDSDCRWFLQLAGMAINLLMSTPRNTASGAVENFASAKGNEEPGRINVSQSRGQAATGPNLNALRGGPAPDNRQHEVVVPIRDGIAGLAEAVSDSLDPAAGVLDDRIKTCIELSSELTSEISCFGVDLSSDDGLIATTTALAIAEELTTSLDEVRRWQETFRTEQRVTYITAIETARVQLGDVRKVLRCIGEEGTSPHALDELMSAAELLQGAVLDIKHTDKSSSQPPGS